MTIWKCLGRKQVCTSIWLEGQQKTTKAVGVIDVLTEIETDHVPSAIPEGYLYTNLSAGMAETSCHERSFVCLRNTHNFSEPESFLIST
jgi:hypothetical protein